MAEIPSTKHSWKNVPCLVDPHGWHALKIAQDPQDLAGKQHKLIVQKDEPQQLFLSVAWL